MPAKCRESSKSDPKALIPKRNSGRLASDFAPPLGRPPPPLVDCLLVTDSVAPNSFPDLARPHGSVAILATNGVVRRTAERGFVRGALLANPPLAKSSEPRQSPKGRTARGDPQIRSLRIFARAGRAQLPPSLGLGAALAWRIAAKMPLEALKSAPHDVEGPPDGCAGLSPREELARCGCEPLS